MKKLICKVLILTLILSIIPLSSSCTANNRSKHNQLTFYESNGSGMFEEIIERYNNYCIKNLDKSYKIKVVKFENEKEMYSTMSTEIMAGGGPDIFCTGQTLPFEKMINNGIFLDINELLNCKSSDIDLSQYNEKILNQGIYNGKRYILPIFYGVSTLITDKNTLKKFNMPPKQGYGISYNDMSVFDNFLADQKGYSIFFGDYSDSAGYTIDMFWEFLYSYIDFEKKTTYFNTDEFKNALYYMCRLIDSSKNITFDQSLNNYLFMSNDMGLHLYYDDKSVIYKSPSKNSVDNKGFIQMGIVVNKNSKLKDKAYEFIKYALSEDAQEHFCNDNADLYAGISFPVNNEAYKHLIEYAKKATDDDGNIMGIDNEFMKAYISIIENINKFSIYSDYQSSYYVQNVIGDIAKKYINGEITKSKFIRQITIATKFYMEE